MTSDISQKVRIQAGGEGAKARRDFLKKAGTVGLTAPAVSILLSSDVKAVPGDYMFPTSPPTTDNS